MGLPFVGRDAELHELEAMIRLAGTDRSPAAALITGEPGSGKSRLLAEVTRAVETWRCVHLAGYEPSQTIPLAAVGGLLRRLAEVPTHGAMLDRVVFGAGDALTSDLFRVFEAGHRAAAGIGPLLITVDDLQWVDEASLSFLDYLLRSATATRQPLVVLAAARPSAASAVFQARIDSQLPAERRVSIELGPLTAGDGRSLARAIDATLDDDAATDLWQRARGSPFWLEALAHTVVGTDPSGLIGDRLRALSADAGTVLGLLAVAARPFPGEDIDPMLMWDTQRARLAIRELVARGLAVHGAGSVRLSHDLVREAVSRTLPTPARRRFHGVLAEAIESAAGDEMSLLSEALEHRAAANLPTAALAGRILTLPQRRLLGIQSLRLLASISDAQTPGTPQQSAMDRDLGDLAGLLGDQELALSRWVRVSTHAATPVERRHAEIEAARAAYRLGRPQEAHDHLDRARDTGPATPEAIARIDALRAEVHLWFDHDTTAGARAAQRAVAASREMVSTVGGLPALSTGQRRTYLAALEAAIGAALQEERISDVSDLTKASLDVAPAIDDESHVSALLRGGFGLRPLGAIRESEAYFRQAWELAQQVVLPLSTLEAGHGWARALRDLGRLVQAREVASAVVELEGRLGHPPARWGNAPSILHGIELSLGEPDALPALRADAASEPNPHYRLAIHLTIATWQARSGAARRVDEVENGLAAARDDALRVGCPRCAAEVSVISAEMLARVGRVHDAKRELAGWERRPVADYLQRRIWRLRARWAIAAAEGDQTQAATLLADLISMLERTGLIDELTWARLDLGRLLADTDRPRAITAFRAAADLAEEIGAASVARLAAQGLRRLGVRTWRRGRAAVASGLGALSGREVQVAHLVAAGETNRAIADSLAISPKTVERHLTNILTKLELRNRAELAGRVGSAAVRDSPDE